MKNSIEENIEILEKFKNNEMQRDKLERDGRCGGWKIGDIYKCLELDNAIDNILSDYKRVLEINEVLLKENEMYKKNSEIMAKENLSTAEQLKVEIKENFRLKNQLENNRKEYQETYKDVREELKELKKENKELKKNYINVQNNTNTTFHKVVPPPEPQLPTKTLCESFSKKARNNNEII